MLKVFSPPYKKNPGYASASQDTPLMVQSSECLKNGFYDFISCYKIFENRILNKCFII